MSTVLSLCDRSGVMVRPWLEAGFRAVIVDLQHDGVTTDGPLTRVGADVRDWQPEPDDYAAVFAFPPCTHLAVSGARWFQEKGLAALIESLQLVEACRRICESLTTCWLLENPHGTLSTYWRKPDYTFDPCDFGGYLDGGGDRYTKLTNLWVGGGFTMPEKRRVEPTEGSKMHRMAPGPGAGEPALCDAPGVCSGRVRGEPERTGRRPTDPATHGGVVKDLPAGWGWPANSRKAHYFPAGSSFSVCGKYGFYFSRREPDVAVSPDDCGACRKKVGAPDGT